MKTIKKCMVSMVIMIVIAGIISCSFLVSAYKHMTIINLRRESKAFHAKILLINHFINLPILA